MLKKINYQLFAILIISVACTNNREEVAHYDNGNIKYRVNIENGEREGVLLKYFDDGKIMMKSNWKEGVNSGESTEYYRNGNIAVKEFFINGQPDGRMEYYDSLGNLRQVMNVKEGFLNGKNIEYFKSGQIKKTEVYRNDLKEGKGVVYNKDGTLRYRLIYHKDTIVYAIEYIDSSYVTSQLLKFDITYDKSNTFRVGKNQRIYVELLYSYYDDSKLGITLGSLDNLGGIKDTIFASKSDSLTVIIDYVPTDVGENKIEGYAYEYTGDSVERVRKHIEIKFNVTK